MIQSIDYQFQLRIDSDPTPQLVEFAIQAAEPVDDNMEQYFASMFRHLANVGNHGGLCGSSLPPELCSIEIVEIRRTGRYGLSFRVRVAGLDQGAWRVISGFMAAISYYSFPLTALTILSTAQISREVLTESLVWQTPYPSHPQKLPFELLQEEVADATRNRLINIQFDRALTGNEIEEVANALLSWDELVNGGFPEEGADPIDNATDAIEAYMIDAQTIEHPLPNFLGHEAAFNVIISMAVWFHQRIAKVLLVEIS